MNPGFKICEIYGPTIQGEGAFIGRPCIFIRVAECPCQCNNCDSKSSSRFQVMES